MSLEEYIIRTTKQLLGTAFSLIQQIAGCQITQDICVCLSILLCDMHIDKCVFSAGTVIPCDIIFTVQHNNFWFCGRRSFLFLYTSVCTLNSVLLIFKSRFWWLK